MFSRCCFFLHQIPLTLWNQLMNQQVLALLQTLLPTVPQPPNCPLSRESTIAPSPLRETTTDFMATSAAQIVSPRTLAPSPPRGPVHPTRNHQRRHLRQSSNTRRATSITGFPLRHRWHINHLQRPTTAMDCTRTITINISIVRRRWRCCDRKCRLWTCRTLANLCEETQRGSTLTCGRPLSNS